MRQTREARRWAQLRAFLADRASPRWRLAADFLTGVDEFGAEYLAAFRAGKLATIAG